VLVYSPMAVAVRQGAPRPDISSETALREAVLAARTLGYSTGPSGQHLLRLLELWGAQVPAATRLVQAPPGVPVARLVAQGDAALGFQQLSELVHESGIQVLGSLPGDAAFITPFAAGLCSAGSRSDAARRFIAHLAAPAAADTKTRHGFAPP
jgi:molybdate transport system substrate-binding protein